MPWRIATGISLIIWALAVFLVGDRLKYLQPYANVLFTHYTLTLSLYLITAVITLYAFIFWLARRAGLGDLGGKLKLMDKRLASGESHDEELALRIKRERMGEME